MQAVKPYPPICMDWMAMVISANIPRQRFTCLPKNMVMLIFPPVRANRRSANGSAIIPNHCCMVTSLFDEVVGARDDQVEVTWQVAARGTVVT